MALLIVGLAAGLAFGMPPQCSPEVLEEIDNPKIREICHFLQTYAEAVEGGAAFVKGKRKLNSGESGTWGNVRLMLETVSAGGSHYPLGLIDNGVKRQDVDHVFLRFGRRRR